MKGCSKQTIVQFASTSQPKIREKKYIIIKEAKQGPNIFNYLIVFIDLFIFLRSKNKKNIIHLENVEAKEEHENSEQCQGDQAAPVAPRERQLP